LVFVAFVLLTLAVEGALRYTRWGLALRAVGSDEESARRVGVRVNGTVVLGYVVASLLVCLGSVVLLAQLGIGDPAQGVGYTLSSITAVVLGGTSLFGGRGTIIGTLSGALIIGVVRNGLVLMGVASQYQILITGILVIVAVSVDQIARKRT
jgi:ribose transport system ATP-binding protein